MPLSRNTISGVPTTASGCIWGETIRATLCLMAFVALAPVLYAVRPKMARTVLTEAERTNLLTHARRVQQWRETSTLDQRITTLTTEEA